MKRSIVISLAVVALTAFSITGSASETKRIKHHKGVMPASLNEAKDLFSEYNKKLEGILQRETLTGEDLGKIHQLSYTLENALGRINKDFAALSETLEELHIASETGKSEKSKTLAKDYLNTSRQVIE